MIDRSILIMQMSEFTTKNAAARHRPADDGSQLDVRDMRRFGAGFAPVQVLIYGCKSRSDPTF